MSEREASAGTGRLYLALSSAWAVAWVVGIGVFALVAIRLGRRLHGQELDTRLALYAAQTYGMAWFDEEGSFHEEVFLKEEDLVDAPVDIWIVGAAAPHTPHLAPERPRFPLESLDALAQEVASTQEELFIDGLAQSGVPCRVHAIPTYQDGRRERARAVIVVVGDSQATASSQASFAARVLLSALALGIIGLAVGAALARWSIRPLARTLAQRERFLSAAAHELRTPVATLQAICDSARAGDEPAALALERVAPLVKHTGTVVDDLLLFARLDAGGAELARQPLRLDLLVEACLPESPSILLEAHESVVSADERLVRVAMRNLIENARLHGSAERPILVSVSGASVTVEDEGPGFPQKILDLAKRPFSLAPSRHGAGIGLATAKLIARLHGGDLRLENPPGGGARATLSFA